MLWRRLEEPASAQNISGIVNAQRYRGTIEPDEVSACVGTVNVEGDAVVAQRGGGLRDDGDRGVVIKGSGANLDLKLIATVDRASRKSPTP